MQDDERHPAPEQLESAARGDGLTLTADVDARATTTAEGRPSTSGTTTVEPRAPSSGLRSSSSPLDRAPPQVGSTIKHYELLRKLGQGGMGTVFLARDTKLGRLVAIKLLLAYGGHRAQRLLAEAQATARCRHENIVVIHEVDEAFGYPYMVLEYVEGRTLRDHLELQQKPQSAPGSPLEVARARTSPLVAAELLIPVVRALVCAHRLGIVHRDLKPENIVLADAGPIKVLDFGIAKQHGAEEISMLAGDLFAGGRAPHGDGALAGTLPYMSPEQLRAEDIDPRSDLWAVGIMLYELVTGAHPLAPFALGWLRRVMDLEAPMPRVDDDRPAARALGDLIERCLKKRREERIGSAEQLLAELEGIAGDGKALALIGDESPFTGLAAFQEADAGRFFGRDRDIAVVRRRLRNQQMVVVAGPSGAGKSSFVRAGVIPAVKRLGDSREAFVVRPGPRPLEALAHLLAQMSDESPNELVAALHVEPGLLGARLRARCRASGTRHWILLFVDQFEELYTLGAPPEERAAFVACIEGVADDASSPLRVVLAIRSDFLDRTAEDRRYSTEVSRALLFLPPIGRNGLREALVRPVEAAGHRFEDEDMIAAMLASLERTRSPLPLLQFMAGKLWDARDRQRQLLTRESYEGLGGIAGALSAHADAVLATLSPREQRLTRAVFLRLVTPERTRAVVSLSELAKLAEGDAAERMTLEHVIQHLASARLLLVEAGGEHAGTTVELCHEALIERWPKLGQWIDESAQDAQFLAELRAAAQQWEAREQADGLLWRDRAAREARTWLSHRRAERGEGAPLGLGGREERYLLAVVALLERAQRRRRQATLGVLATLVAVALVVSSLAIRAAQEAAHARMEAARADHQAALVQAEAVQARNATRMATARELQGDPTTVLALVRELEPPEVPRGWSELARFALESGVAHVVLHEPAGITRAAFSPDGQRIVTACVDTTARVWSADGAGAPVVLRGHEDRVAGAAFSPDGQRIVTASWDRTARIWNADGTGQPIVLRGHDDVVFSAAFSPDGQRVVTASWDGTARIWSADGAGEPVVLRAGPGWVWSAAWRPDGQRIVTASGDFTARVWNADGTGQPIPLQHDDVVYSASFSPDGQRIVTASQDKTAQVWSADGKGKPVVLRGHEDVVFSAAWSPDGRHVATASWDKTARVWDVSGAGQPLVLRGHQDLVAAARYSPDGERLVTASLDRTARVWALQSIRSPLILRGHLHGIASVAYSPDGRNIVTASHDFTAQVRRADGGGEPVVLRGHKDIVFSAAYSPDGRHVVTASYDNAARIFPVDGAAPPLVLAGHEAPVTSAAFSPDGQRIVTASYDRTVQVHDANGGGQPLILRGHAQPVMGVSYSPDGRRMASASMDTTVRLWSADGTGEPLVLRGHQDRVSTALWSPDGKHIVSASWDKTVRVWNADGTGEPLVLRGHLGVVNAAAYSPDGTHIVSASDDRTVRVWNADGTGEPLVLRGPELAVKWATYSPDGKHIACASDDRAVWVWSDLDPIRSVEDPELWTATEDCMPVERRMEILRISEAMARAHRESCVARVAAARARGLPDKQ
ncbi:protein kinase domain-containing protein [Polyangium sorediatum]|uniref:Protein kinase n=1 Tax=Polyangium sorediatum TaxID=889274 RepID=A0ABT6NS92_9BACT|nr:protein kinase [Polyangium sorediatum]MDI1431183.1 protein kinase [Polyangium sorediatum]